MNNGTVLRRRKTYTVTTYWCPSCGHIFHTSKPKTQIKKICNKCHKAEIKQIDKYKSKKPYRASGSRGNWFSKDKLYAPRRHIK